MSKLRATLAAAAICLAGSAHAGDVPYERSFPSASQAKAMSVQHWTVIANDLVLSLMSSLGDGAKRGIYFSISSTATPFEKELVKFMIDSAVSKGAIVYSRPTASALNVDVSTTVVSHNSKAQALSMPATFLSAGVLVLREVALENWKAGLMAAGVLSDVTNKVAKPPSRSEFAVTLSVEDRGVYLSRKSNVYYVDSADVGLFLEPPGRVFRVEGGQ